MKTSLSTRAENRQKNVSFLKKIALVFVIAVFSGGIGEIYGTLVYGLDEGDYYRGFRAGFSIGLIAAFIEVFYIRSQRRSWIRRVAFLPGLVVRILAITLIIRVCLVANELLTNWLSNKPLTVEFDAKDQVRDTLFSLAIVIVFVIMSQLTSIIGLKRFLNLVVGRYFKPVNEERVFLFVDLVGSSKLARELGNEKFHEILSEFFYQLDQAIVRTGGEIVSYVGDAVIVTWPLGDDGKRNARCLLALAHMRRNMMREAKNFKKTFGVVPEFRAALHGGHVVVGECGDSRRQVTFLGDVVNMTARIEQLTKETGEQFLASKSVLNRMTFPKGIAFEEFGERLVKGADAPIHLQSIKFSGL